MTALYGVPSLLFLLVALAASLALAAGGQMWVHRRFRRQDFIAHNEVGGTIMAVSGTLYAVMLGLLTVAMWQHYLEAHQLVVMESDADIDVWHAAVGLPSAVRERVRSDVLRYAQIMTTREWPLMKRGENDATAAMIGMDATDAAGGLVPANSGQSNAQAATLQQLIIMHDARQQRIAVNMVGLSWFEWLILLLGGMCIMCFCWLFGLHNARVHLLMTSMVATIIVAALVLVFELQYPFRSDVGISPDAWSEAVTHIHQMQAGAMTDMRR